MNHKQPHKIRKPKNFDPEYASAWANDLNRRVDLLGNAVEQLHKKQNDIIDFITKQGNMVHYVIEGINVLVEKGVTTHEEIREAIKKSSDATIEDLSVQSTNTTNESGSRCNEQGILPGSSDFRNQKGSIESCDTTPDPSDVV